MTRCLGATMGLLVAILTGAYYYVSSDRAADSKPAATEDYNFDGYRDWPAITPKPVRVSEFFFGECEMHPEVLKELRRRGPHFVPAIMVYANPVAFQAFQAEPASAMPIGSIVVKEKSFSNEDGLCLIAYAAMIKHKPGYDYDHGDWEYRYVQLADGLGEPMSKPEVTRGKLQQCIGCHQAAAAKDYLYRQYKDFPEE